MKNQNSILFIILFNISFLSCKKDGNSISISTSYKDDHVMYVLSTQLYTAGGVIADTSLIRKFFERRNIHRDFTEYAFTLKPQLPAFDTTELRISPNSNTFRWYNPLRASPTFFRTVINNIAIEQLSNPGEVTISVTDLDTSYQYSDFQLMDSLQQSYRKYKPIVLNTSILSNTSFGIYTRTILKQKLPIIVQSSNELHLPFLSTCLFHATGYYSRLDNNLLTSITNVKPSDTILVQTKFLRLIKM